MSKEYYSLESIIKVEPEKFQAIEWKSQSCQSIDDVLRSKAKIFSDPVVFLKRIDESSASMYPDQRQLELRTLKTYLRKGNEGVPCLAPHTCCFCQKVLSIRSALMVHLEMVHCRSMKRFCDLCPKFYFSKTGIIEHLKRTHAKKRFACNICEFKTAAKDSFKYHMKTHSTEVECPICKRFVKALDEHLKRHSRPKAQCPTCQKHMNKACLNRHIRETHSTCKEVLKCKNCERTFETKEEFKRHNLTNHYEGKLYDCHCGSVFKSNSSLRQHQETHNEKQTCKVCQRQFLRRSSLWIHWNRSHLNTHGLLENLKMRMLNINGPFVCDKCGWKCQNRVTFRKHIYKIHQFRERSYDLCARSFNEKRLLVRHMNRTHLNLHQFKCTICNYKSNVSDLLKRHLKRHSLKTACKVCNKNVTNMYNHMRTHVEVKCKICSKILKKKSFSRHLKTHKN